MKFRVESLKEAVILIAKHAFRDNLLHWSAAIAFYSALSFAPLMFIVLVGSSFFVDTDWAASRITTILGNFLPDESDSQVREFVRSAVQSRGQIGIFSFFAFLYTGTRVFAALTRAIHVIFDDEEERQFLREVGAQFVMLMTLGAFFLLALSSRFLFRGLSNTIDLLPSGEENFVMRVVAGGVQLALLFASFTLMYRYVPGDRDSWRPALVGAAVATVIFAIVRPLFTFYLDRFGQQQIIYGSLASLAILLLWVWIGAIITLLGAEIVNYIRNGPREGQPA